MSIYVEILIRAPMEALWAHSQTPELHERWDLRFSRIDYLPRASGTEPQRFRYATRIGFGLEVVGEGESLGERDLASGSRSSALKFTSADSRSLIREGAGAIAFVSGLKHLAAPPGASRMNPLADGSSSAIATKTRKHETFLVHMCFSWFRAFVADTCGRTNLWGNRQAAAVRKSLAGFWNVMSGAARRRAQAQWRAEWCRVRFDEAAIEIEVQERPVWRNRVAWDEILGVGIEPKGLLGPGFNLFVAREPGVVWASLEGAGAVALHDELRRRGVLFRPPADLWRECDERLKRQARTLMQQGYPPTEWLIVQAELDSYRGNNIGRTQVAIVRLADGDLQKVHELAAQARRGDGSIVSRDIAENVSGTGTGKASSPWAYRD